MSATAAVEVRRREFTVDEYEQMGRVGILSEDDRVELLDGEIVEMQPIGPSHAGHVNRLTELFVSRLAGRATVIVQNPLRLDRRSEPQPDLTIARPRADFYSNAHPAPEDALLVIEVADSSLRVDREVKVPLYAKASIAELWIVDLAAEELEAYREPSGSGYATTTRLRRGDSIAPLSFPDVTIELIDVLG